MALWLARHGETGWTVSGQHTGRTDIALVREGELQAVALGRLLDGRKFEHVFASPMRRRRKPPGWRGSPTGSGSTRACGRSTTASTRA